MKALHIIRREYTASVRKKSFIVGTILVPVLMAAFLVVPLLFVLLTPDEQYNMVVLDFTGAPGTPGAIGDRFVRALDDTPGDGRARYVATVVAGGDQDFARSEAIAAINAGRLDLALEIPADIYEENSADYITKDVRNFQVMERFEDLLSDLVLRKRLEDEGLDYQRVANLTSGVSVSMNQIKKSGEVEEKDFLSDWALVFVFVMILYSAMFTWGSVIQRGILEEKGSRVIEVLLSSMEPIDLFTGKIVGIGLAGLTQLAIWSVVGLGFSAYAATATASLLQMVQVPPVVFVYFIVFFVLGFLLYSSIFSVIGAVCSTEQDAQQLQGYVTLIMIIPLLCLMLIIQSPNSTMATVLSLIPVFTPMLMLARIIVVQPPFWQIALGIALLGVSIYLAINFSARVFRIGILMYGKRPSIREVIRWYKYS